MAKKSTVISVRLHPHDPHEAEALAIIDELQGKGYSNREIVTDAIVRAKGHTPEMFKDASSSITQGVMQNMLSEFASHIIQELRNQGLMVSSQKSATSPSPFGEDEDTQAAQNLANGFLARRNQGGRR